jgi:hypothetical protein
VKSTENEDYMRVSLESVFGILTIVFLATLLEIAVGYPFRVRLFPSIVLTTTLILVLLITLRPVMPETIRRYTEAGFDILSADAFSKGKKEGDAKPFFITLILLADYFVMLYFTGFLFSTFVFTYIFLKLNQYDSKKSLAYSFGSALIAFTVFGLLMGIPLPSGVIIEWMGY